MADDTTTIRLKEDTVDDLYELKGRNDTYDDVVSRLLALERDCSRTHTNDVSTTTEKESNNGN